MKVLNLLLIALLSLGLTTGCMSSKPKPIGAPISIKDNQNLEWRFIPVKDITMTGNVVSPNARIGGSLTQMFAGGMILCTEKEYNELNANYVSQGKCPAQFLNKHAKFYMVMSNNSNMKSILSKLKEGDKVFFIGKQLKIDGIYDSSGKKMELRGNINSDKRSNMVQIENITVNNAFKQ